MAKPLNDNANEVARKSAQVNELLDKYEVIVSDSGFTKGVVYDKVDMTYQTLTDTFTYTLAAVTQATVVITYSASNKKVILSIHRT